jgi:hypothetical protein
LLLFCTIAWAEAGKTGPSGSNGALEGLYGTYQFKKQIYMNPLSSFLALDGFHEYYTFSENSFIITDQGGNQRSMTVTYQPEAFDEAIFKNSFMMEGFDIPDITLFKDRRQYTVTETSGSMVYRLYLLDNEIWLAQIHKDNANVKKNTYIWSIFQIERYEGEIPLTFSASGTQNGVKDFLALQGDFHWPLAIH